MKSAIGEVMTIIKQPLVAIKKAVKHILKKIKKVLLKIRKVMIRMKNLIIKIRKIYKISIKKKILKIVYFLVNAIKGAFDFLANIVSICNKNIGTPFQRCINMLKKGNEDCM